MIVVSAAVACVVFIASFVGRARLGRRSRAIGGVRSPLRRRVTSRAVKVGIARALLGALAGMVAGGAVLACIGALAGGISERVLRARETRARDRRIAGQLPDMIRSLAGAIRSGRSIPQALEIARDEATLPLRPALDTAVARLSVGATLDEALHAFGADAGGSDAALVVETLLIGRAAGANLPQILDVAIESLAERSRIARDRAATSAQAKMSALVVGLMPLAFFGIIGSGARDQLHVLLGDPIGWALLAGGVILEACGALWMRALMRPR